MNKDELDRIVDLHGKWLRDESGGQYANLRDADLRYADLSNANLSNANTPTPISTFAIDIAIADAISAKGNSLDMSDWHSADCQTTHCRGGWATELHPEGRGLELKYGTSTAAALIYATCSTREVTPGWTQSNGDAMADILACAEKQRAELESRIPKDPPS